MRGNAHVRFGGAGRGNGPPERAAPRPGSTLRRVTVAGCAPHLAPRGCTPVIRHHFKWKRVSMAAGLCYGSRGGGAQLAFHHHPDAYDTDSLIGALGELRQFLGGQKATLLWDGLPAHRSKAMRAWLRRQRSWLVVEPLPGYAPELNPVEPLWSSLKGVELANLAADTLDDVIAAAEHGIHRIRHTHHLAFSFLRYCGLSLW
jgi:transposase